MGCYCFRLQNYTFYMENDIKGVEDVLKRSFFGSFVPLLALNGVLVFILSTERTLTIIR